MKTLDVAGLPLRGTQLIEASAGTGKTHAITSLFLRLVLEQQLTIDRILVVTFTHAATDELRGKIRQRLDDALQLLMQPERLAAETDTALRDILLRCQHADDYEQRLQHLRAQTSAMDDAAIFTIHGFCQRTLGACAFDSGALFEATLEEDSGALLRRAAADWWRQRFYPDAAATRFAASRTLLRTPDAVFAFIRTLIRHEAAFDVMPFDAARHAALPALVRAAWQQEGAELLADLREHTAAGYLSKAETTLRADKLIQAAAEMDAFCTDIHAPTPGNMALRLRQSFIQGCSSKKAVKAGFSPPVFSVSTLLDELLAQHEGCEHALIVNAIHYCRQESKRLKEQAGILGFDDIIQHLRDALTADNGTTLASRIAAQYPAALIDEFQDTDPAQYTIFQRIYGAPDETRAPSADQPSRCLLMIGDPKQAIYSFRGADIFAYIDAQAKTPLADRHTLGTNWRSTKPLVNAVNMLFGRLGDATFLYPDAIGFTAVTAAGKADETPLLIEGKRPTPMLFDLTPPPAKNQHSKEIFRDLAAQATAARIATLLNAAQNGQAMLGDRALERRDIAVLVRSHRDGALMQLALHALGVGSAVASPRSVYETDEAEDLVHLLAAIIAPGNERLLRRALASSIWRCTADDIAALDQEDAAADALRERIVAYHQRWQTQGFMPMFRQWLHREDIPAKLGRGAGTRLTGAERALTNLLQLAELLQQAAREHATPEALLGYLVDATRDPDNRGEEQQLRLESDENLVQILTQHKSKGLQYPVVFLPSLAVPKKYQNTPPITWHDAQRHHTVSLRSTPQASAAAVREHLAEEIRMAYVALTRAQYLCVLACGAVSDSGHGALSWLLHGDGDIAALADWPERAKKLSHDDWRIALNNLVKSAPESFAVADMPVTATPLQIPPDSGNNRQARTAQRRIEQSWRQTSFSTLAGPSTPRELFGEGTDDATLMATYNSTTEFPRGRHAGNFFHAVLENIDFPTAQGEPLRHTIREQLLRHGFAEQWLPAVEKMIADILDAPIHADGLTLRNLPKLQVRHEMEFFYPLQQLSVERLAALLPTNKPDEKNTLHDSAPTQLNFSSISGMMHGFIDLVFCHAGRYYLADWKSNWLGPDASHYAQEKLHQAIQAHHYDLQYCIYSVALHHYLQARIPDYDIDQHFGGVYYFFLRGMKAPSTTHSMSPNNGVYFRRAPRSEILALAAAMRHGDMP